MSKLKEVAEVFTKPARQPTKRKRRATATKTEAERMRECGESHFAAKAAMKQRLGYPLDPPLPPKASDSVMCAQCGRWQLLTDNCVACQAPMIPEGKV